MDRPQMSCATPPPTPRKYTECQKFVRFLENEISPVSLIEFSKFSKTQKSLTSILE